MATSNSTPTTRARKGATTATSERSTMRLVQTKPVARKSSAPRLRAGIIEGTLGEGAGPYPKLPAGVQRALDQKARILADESFEVIRESLMRSVGNKCFCGLNFERFEAEEALHLIAEKSLDEALAPLVRRSLETAMTSADFVRSRAQKYCDDIAAELRRFDQPSREGSAA